MKNHKPKFGFTLTELLIVVLVISICTSLMLPAIANSRGDSMIQESMSNLATLSIAHVLYAADFNGRQVTFAVDDLSLYGSVANYNSANGCSGAFDPGCIPPIIAGWGESSGTIGLYSYWLYTPGHYWAVKPMGFPGGQGVEGASLRT